MLYRSSFDASKLIQAANEELAENDPPAFLVILLGLCVGLRKGEIDLLPWSAVKFNSGLIRIEPTEYFDVKTEHSIGDVPVDPEILEILRGFRARTKSPFVIASSRAPRRTTTYEHYRCEPLRSGTRLAEGARRTRTQTVTRAAQRVRLTDQRKVRSRYG
jgi:hypothetical protein